MNSISIVTTCVNFSDYLELVAPSWDFAREVIVATKESDHKTLEICSQHNFKTCITNGFDCYGTKNKPAAFNKWSPLNKAMDMLDDPQWILVTDADMAYPQNTVELLIEEEFDREVLYGMQRIMVTHINYVLNIAPIRIDRKGYKLESLLYSHYRDNIPLGFFQLFWNQGQRYKDTFGTAATGDVLFAKKWEQRQFIPDYHAFHMGTANTHWNGRVEDGFFTVSA